MGKKRKPKAMLEEGFWQEFEDTLEHLKQRRAIVVVTLDRVSGEVEIDGAMTTPAEAWYALSRAEQKVRDALSPEAADDELAD